MEGTDRHVPGKGQGQGDIKSLEVIAIGRGLANIKLLPLIVSKEVQKLIAADSSPVVIADNQSQPGREGRPLSSQHIR